MTLQTKEYLKQLLLRHINGTISESEREQLFVSLDSGEQEEDWKALIQDLSTAVESTIPYNDQEWEPIIQGILEQSSHPREGSAPVRRMPGRKWWWAAAAVLIIAIGSLVIITNKHRPDQTLVNRDRHLQSDALPGRNGAVLTLANNKKVLLDSLGNGVIATQGKTTVLIRNGRLVYDAKVAGNAVLYNTMNTPKGRKYQLVLPDGTQVWLNAESSITYPTAFTGNERKVRITGEVYFEVAKDKTKPFRVNINDQSEAEVLGTHFDINGYADEGSIKTTLLEGSIKVVKGALNDGSSGVVLRPGQQALVAGAVSVSSNVDLDQVMAWKNGLFNFEGADIRTVMQQLARWYDIDVKYEGAVPQLSFHGEITQDLNLSQVIKLLEDVEVKFRIEGKTLIVRQ